MALYVNSLSNLCKQVRPSWGIESPDESKRETRTSKLFPRAYQVHRTGSLAFYALSPMLRRIRGVSTLTEDNS